MAILLRTIIRDIAHLLTAAMEVVAARWAIGGGQRTVALCRSAGGDERVIGPSMQNMCAEAKPAATRCALRNWQGGTRCPGSMCVCRLGAESRAMNGPSWIGELNCLVFHR
jgi:hypothetical protein